jgi:hypothetical protein
MPTKTMLTLSYCAKLNYNNHEPSHSALLLSFALNDPFGISDSIASNIRMISEREVERGRKGVDMA